MPITLSCPSCDRKLNAKDEHAGRTLRCPACQSAITVPFAGAAPRPLASVVGVVPPPVPPQQPATVTAPTSTPVTVSSSTVTAKSFCCNGCGTPLKIPKNSKGHVQCLSCRNDCVLEGLVKNAEIAAKENIVSGVSLDATPTTLHRQLLSLLSKSPGIPLDIFEKIEVVREERYCIPAYIFYCNATTSFSYESGTVVKSYSEGETDTHYTKTEYTDTQWHGQNGSVSASLTMLAPGNKSLAKQIVALYSNFDFNRLTDLEELEIPPDVETHKFNLILPVAFDEYVQPKVEELLENKARDHLSGRMIRNLSMGGSNIQKETVRVFLGLYHVVYKYGGKNYSIWVTGDGRKAYHELLPEDAQRQATLDELETQLSSIPENKTGPSSYWIVATIIAAPFTFGMTLIATVVLIAMKVIASNKGKEFDAQRNKIQQNIDAFDSHRLTVIRQFKQQKKALRGIYERVTNDSEAF